MGLREKDGLSFLTAEHLRMASAQLSELMANITTLRTKRRLPDMLRCMEDALALRVTMHGELSADVQEAAASLLKEYNAAAMSMLRSGSFFSAHAFRQPCH